MSIERSEPHAAGAGSPVAESNGTHASDRGTLVREVVLLRARCSNLRHWCRLMLADPAAPGVLDEPTVADIRDLPPEIGELEAHDLICQFARGGSVPANHPLVPVKDDVGSLHATVTSLATEPRTF